MVFYFPLGYNADVICLQEVDKKVFEKALEPSLQDTGFSGLLSLKCGDVAEGTAIFYRNNKFRLELCKQYFAFQNYLFVFLSAVLDCLSAVSYTSPYLELATSHS